MALAEYDQKEIDRKKEYLKEYEKVVRQTERAELKMREIHLSKVIPSVANDGMPHTRNNSDLSSYAVLADRAEKEYMQYKNEQAQKCEEITNKIEQLENEDEKDILAYRYIKLLRWIDISAEMGYCRQHIYRIHKDALRNFKI